MIELKGIAWNHSRGFVSVVATAQRYEELHPEVRITWEKRSLQAFADSSLESLAEVYDLIVMDHPHVALAAREKILAPLDEYLPEAQLADLAANSVGGSHDSYRLDGHQWTLATDAATPIATWRPDLLHKHSLTKPDTWEDLLAMAERGQVTVSLFPIDVLMHVYMFCEALGNPAFQSSDELAPASVLSQALQCLKDLAERVHPDCLQRDPIGTAEYMSRSDDLAAAYCPFAYGYSNYSRNGYAKYVLKAGGLVSFNGRALRSLLGGAGLAVSARSQYLAAATDYAGFTALAETQKGIYYENGGQPGHRAAWLDESVNASSGQFFRDTLITLDAALQRPQYPGYMFFQDSATPIAHAAVAGRISILDAVQQLTDLYLESRKR
jgi:multiple sugar transport system substrate-binding protein